MQVGTLPGQPRGPGRAALPSSVGALPTLHLLQEPKECYVLASLQYRVGKARRRDERWRKYEQSRVGLKGTCVPMISENYLLRSAEI